MGTDNVHALWLAKPSVCKGIQFAWKVGLSSFPSFSVSGLEFTTSLSLSYRADLVKRATGGFMAAGVAGRQASPLVTDVYNVVSHCERWPFFCSALVGRRCGLCRDTRFPNAVLNSCIRMAYTKGFTMELPKDITASIRWISRFDSLFRFASMCCGRDL